MTTNPTHAPEADDRDEAYARLVAHYSAPETVAAALARVKAQARHRQAARDLVTRARGGLLHNYTVREIARYFRAADRGRVDLLQVAEGTGIPLGGARQVLREFVDAGLLNEYEQPVGEEVRRSYELADGARGGVTQVFIETEAAQREEHAAREGGRNPGRLGWTRS